MLITDRDSESDHDIQTSISKVYEVFKFDIMIEVVRVDVGVTVARIQVTSYGPDTLRSDRGLGGPAGLGHDRRSSLGPAGMKKMLHYQSKNT
jgi:hypothetical protein